MKKLSKISAICILAILSFSSYNSYSQTKKQVKSVKSSSVKNYYVNDEKLRKTIEKLSNQIDSLGYAGHEENQKLIDQKTLEMEYYVQMRKSLKYPNENPSGISAGTGKSLLSKQNYHKMMEPVKVDSKAGLVTF